jgi:asparagine synthase (glutamine-hydrolysing)
VADYLGTKHTEIVVTEQEMFDAIPEVIYAIESYDTTTVRASIGNYLLGKYISQNSEAKVILNGDGSDEVCGGYLYMHKCPDNIEFDRETVRLLRDIHTFDVLRSDKSISSHGLEPRTPFLDRSFVNNYLSIPIDFRNHVKNGTCEKFLLRNSFNLQNFRNANGKQILPNEILWRKKEAFSDGVTSNTRSLFEILQEKILATYDSFLVDNRNQPLSRLDYEKHYYKSIFEKHFPNLQQIIPYYWMPKYTNATDPSARTLDIYSA